MSSSSIRNEFTSVADIIRFFFLPMAWNLNSCLLIHNLEIVKFCCWLSSKRAPKTKSLQQFVNIAALILSVGTKICAYSRPSWAASHAGLESIKKMELSSEFMSRWLRRKMSYILSYYFSSWFWSNCESRNKFFYTHSNSVHPVFQILMENLSTEDAFHK